MDVSPQGRVRRVLEGIDAAGIDTEKQFALTQQLEQLVALGSAPYEEIVRIGRSFVVNTTTAIGAVVAIPTTAHMLAIYNNEPDGGRSYVIDWLAAQNVVSTAVASQAQLLCNVGQVRETAPTDAALAVKQLDGFGNKDSRVRTILNATALPATTGIAGQWLPWGPSVGKPGAAGTPGYGLWAAVDGRIIVPPGRYFALHVLANVVGETFMAFIAWHEAQLTLA